MTEMIVIVEGGRVKKIGNIPEGTHVLVYDLDVTEESMGATDVDGMRALVMQFNSDGTKTIVVPASMEKEF